MEDNQDETSGHSSLFITVLCNLLTDYLLKQCSFTHPYMRPKGAGKTVGDDYKLLFSLHWPEDDKSILPIVSSVDDTTFLSILNTVIASLPDPS